MYLVLILHLHLLLLQELRTWCGRDMVRLDDAAEWCGSSRAHGGGAARGGNSMPQHALLPAQPSFQGEGERAGQQAGAGRAGQHAHGRGGEEEVGAECTRAGPHGPAGPN